MKLCKEAWEAFSVKDNNGNRKIGEERLRILLQDIGQAPDDMDLFKMIH